MRLVIFISIILNPLLGFCLIQSAATGNWNNTATWVGGVVPTSIDDIEIISGHTITLTADASVKNITLTNGSIAIGSFTFSVYGDLTGAQLNNISSTASSTLSIQNTGTAAIFPIPTSITKLKKLIMNRPTGASASHTLDLDDAVPADSIVLVLTNGIMYMNGASVFQLNSHAIQRNIPCSDASHIDGKVQRAIQKTSGMHVFPLGDNGICRPMALEAGNGTTNIEQIQFIYATPPISTTVNAANLPGGIFQNFYWHHENLSSTNMQRRLYFNDSDFPGFTDAQLTASLYLANSDGVSEWDIPVNPRSIDVTNNFIQFNNASAANKDFWTFGSDNATVPISNIHLPIELIYFTASIDVHGVMIDWSTASELNNEFFEVERSQDGLNFESLAQMQGAGSSDYSIQYSYIDEAPLSNISYYRLKQVDYDGNHSYSNICAIEYSNSSILYSFLPFRNNVWELKIKGDSIKKVECSIYTTKGSLIDNVPIIITEVERNSLIDFSKYGKNHKIIIATITINDVQFFQKIHIQ